MTNQVNVAGQDGGGKPVTLRAEQAADNSLAMHVVPEVAGAAVSSSNPLPVSPPAMATVATATAANSLVLKAAPGILFAINANGPPTQSGFVMLLDAVAAPADGNVSPRRAWFWDATTQATIDKTFNPPLAMTTGAVLVFSTSGPFSKTTPGAAEAQFAGEIL